MKPLKPIIAASMIFVVGTIAAVPMPQATPQRPTTENIASNDIFELDFDENVATPKVSGKQHEAIKEYMRRQATGFYKKGYKVETMRSGEVVIVTLPTDEIFLPNDSAMIHGADQKLKPFLPYLNSPDRFKVIATAHSDDTGSESHQQQLTEGRISALYEWFDNNADNTSMLVGYPMGGAEPLKPNNSRQNRRDNRRLEIYIVPNSSLISDAKSGKL